MRANLSGYPSFGFAEILTADQIKPLFSKGKPALQKLRETSIKKTLRRNKKCSLCDKNRQGQLIFCEACGDWFHRHCCEVFEDEEHLPYFCISCLEEEVILDDEDEEDIDYNLLCDDVTEI